MMKALYEKWTVRPILNGEKLGALLRDHDLHSHYCYSTESQQF